VLSPAGEHRSGGPEAGPASDPGGGAGVDGSARLPGPERRVPIVGRSEEQRLLTGLLAAAGRGGGGSAVIEGDAGAGKTCLTRWLAVEAAALGFRCFTGRAAQLERHRPFGTIAEALGIGAGGPAGAGGSAAALAAEVAGLLSGDPATDPAALVPGPPDTEFRIIDALVELMEQLCGTQPVLLVLEDVQWADPSTALWLNRLSREVPRLACAVAVTLRPLPRPPALQALLDRLAAWGARPIRLGPLAGGDPARLAAGALGAQPGPRLRAELGRAGGNPFYILELIASLERGQAIVRQPGMAELRRDLVPIPESLSSVILHRLSFLREEELEILQVAAVIGSTFSVTELATAVGKQVPELAPIMASALRGGVLGEAGSRLTFRQELIRDVLYWRMDPPLRAWLHLAVAQILAESGRPREAVADHIVRGAVPGDVHAAEWLETAARAAAARSPVVAAELLQRAIELAPPGDPHRRQAQADLAGYLLWSGRPAAAEAICSDLLSGGPDAGIDAGPAGSDAGTDRQLRLCLIEALIARGRSAEGLRQVEAAIESPLPDAGYRARLLSLASTCRVNGWDLPGAVAAATQALALAEQSGEAMVAGVALSNLSMAHNLHGEFPEALRRAEEGLGRLRDGVSPRAQPLQPVLAVSAALIECERYGEALELLASSRRQRLTRGAGWNHPLDHLLSGIARFWVGDWDEALASLSLGLDIAETTGMRRGTVDGRALSGLIFLHRGDLAAARAEVSAAEADAGESGPPWRPDWILWARALVTEAAGDAAGALTTLRAAWRLCRAAGVAAEYPVIGPDTVRLALACGDHDLAADVVTALEELAASAGVAGITGAALRCRGLLGTDPGALAEAVAAYRPSPRRRELALACEDAAIALAGRPAGLAPPAAPGAAALGAEALEIYTALDARGDLGRARARLRAAGLDSCSGPGVPAAAGRAGQRPRTPGRGRLGTPGMGASPRVSRRAAAFRPGALTPTEAQVAGYIAQGWSNREVAEALGVSSRTVQSHVSNALEKLGLTSRVELALWSSASSS
jgi:DNA-binding CsgD family transcriptional regulator/tetratricopeptide (TPR) repeat protein